MCLKFDFGVGEWKEAQIRTGMESFFEKRKVWFQVMKVGVVKVRTKKRRAYAKKEDCCTSWVNSIVPKWNRVFLGKLDFPRWNRVFLGKLEFPRWIDFKPQNGKTTSKRCTLQMQTYNMTKITSFTTSNNTQTDFYYVTIVWKAIIANPSILKWKPIHLSKQHTSHTQNTSN